MSSSLPSPPAYESIMSTGFPAGYFLIKSIPTQRVLDVAESSSLDGTQVIAWPELDSSWVEGFRAPLHDNQLFFIDETGALCSKASGHALDVQDGCVVLRRRRPMTNPFPNAYSHPLPRFHFFPSTGQISVIFSSDPTNLLSTHASSFHGSYTANNWQSKRFILTTLPSRRENSLVDDATDFINNTASMFSSSITSLFAPKSPMATTSPSSLTFEDVSSRDIELREDEVLESERAPHEELDDSPERLRLIRVVELSGKEADSDSSMSESARLRKKWTVIPILKEKTRTGHFQQS